MEYFIFLFLSNLTLHLFSQEVMYNLFSCTQMCFIWGGCYPDLVQCNCMCGDSLSWNFFPTHACLWQGCFLVSFYDPIPHWKVYMFTYLWSCLPFEFLQGSQKKKLLHESVVMCHSCSTTGEPCFNISTPGTAVGCVQLTHVWFWRTLLATCGKTPVP